MKRSFVPGMAVAVVHHDSIVLSKGYGKTSSNDPVTADTSFPIASLSKAFTATAILQLVDEGKIDLDAPVLKYLPSLKIDDERASTITIRQLLNQTSGLSDKGFSEFTVDKEPATQNEFISQMNEANLTDSPGSKFHYHNPNFRLLAAVVESISGRNFSDYLNDNVFQRVGMNHSNDYSNTSLFYIGNHGTSEGHIFLFGKPLARQDPEWFVAGAAGVVSTANDMSRWLLLQTNKANPAADQLLSGKSWVAMRSRPSGVNSSYGMGWFVRPDSSLSHNGILWTYSSEAIVDIRNRFGVVLLFNGGINPYTDYNSFLRGIVDILNNKEPELSSIPDVAYPVLVAIVFVCLSALLIHSIFTVKKWRIKYEHLARWKSWLYMALRLIPLCLLIFVPLIITVLSGRVLSWPRIFLMAPDIIGGLLILSVLNLIVAGNQLFLLSRDKK